MSDLPADHVTPCPPFTSVGLHVFGSWEISTKKTRGGSVNSKRWAVMFTCLYTRAVHIDFLESMSTSSLINALHRVFAFRRPAKIIRSDQVTNFVGAATELKLILGRESVKQLLQKRGCTWIFNPPKAPHMGGIWERMIGVAKKILTSIFSSQKKVEESHFHFLNSRNSLNCSLRSHGDHYFKTACRGFYRSRDASSTNTSCTFHSEV